MGLKSIKINSQFKVKGLYDKTIKRKREQANVCQILRYTLELHFIRMGRRVVIVGGGGGWVGGVGLDKQLNQDTSLGR